MDEDRIELVLAKTSELRSKITNCIRKTTSNVGKEGKESEFKEPEEIPDAEYQENDGYVEAESLLNIRYALESLEGQLSSLQALQQQQWYEKEAALAEIEYSQKKLLKELKEYRGKDLEVIREAISFASETEDSNELLLPPYPTHPHSAVSDNGYLSTLSSTSKFTQNGAIISGLKNLRDVSKNLHKSERDQGQFVSRGPFDRVKALIGAAAKTVLTIVGVITILSVAGFEPMLRKQDNQFKLLDLLQLQCNEESRTTVECPPGKVLTIENGEVRCVVKERVEVPFESLVAAPDVNYGRG